MSAVHNVLPKRTTDKISLSSSTNLSGKKASGSIKSSGEQVFLEKARKITT